MAIRKNVKNVKKIISAGLIIYRQTESGVEFLLLYRGRNVWDMPRGKIEISERSLETAFREVREETGLKRADLQIKSNFKAYEKFPFTKNKENFFKIVIFYLAETNSARIVISDEHKGYAWFTVSEARKHLSRFKMRINILEKANNYIKKSFCLRQRFGGHNNKIDGRKIKSKA